jgi:hypothetical protein
MPDLSIEAGRSTRYYEKVTIDNTTGGVGFTAAKINGTGAVFEPTRACQEVMCTVELTGAALGDPALRFTTDGTAPTTTVGHLLGHGDVLTLKNVFDIQNFRAIRTGAVSADLHVSYKY